MFAKLLKHEWKSSASILGVLSLAALGLGILAVLILRLLVANSEHFFGIGTNLGTLANYLVMLVGLILLALVAYVVGTQIVLLVRFYKSKFTAEGYLTFTLPVTTHQIFLSSWLNMLIWTAISMSVYVVVILIAALFGPVEQGLVNIEVLQTIGDLADAWVNSGSTGERVLLVLLGIVGVISSPVICMTCLTLGAVWAKKHKILAAFGIYYVFSIVTNFLNSFMMVFAALLMPFESAVGSGVYLVRLLVQLGLAVGGYFLSVHLMQRRLNLP